MRKGYSGLGGHKYGSCLPLKMKVCKSLKKKREGSYYDIGSLPDLQSLYRVTVWMGLGSNLWFSQTCRVLKDIRIPARVLKLQVAEWIGRQKINFPCSSVIDGFTVYGRHKSQVSCKWFMQHSVRENHFNAVVKISLVIWVLLIRYWRIVVRIWRKNYQTNRQG